MTPIDLIINLLAWSAVAVIGLICFLFVFVIAREVSRQVRGGSDDQEEEE